MMAVKEPEERYDTVDLERTSTRSKLTVNFPTPTKYSTIIKQYPGWYIVDGHKVKS